MSMGFQDKLARIDELQATIGQRDLVRSFGETIYTHIIEHAKNIGIDLD